jgi:hypothetical protein
MRRHGFPLIRQPLTASPMRRSALLLLLAVPSCAPATLARGSADAGRRTPEAALLTALTDTTSVTRVYLPSEVAKQAESIEEPDRAIGGLTPAVEATLREAAVRGVVDTLGFAERATIAILPGSDPREASLLVRRAERGRWRPARLASGQAVRQLFEWRFCRTNTGTCPQQWEQVPLDRTLPHISAQ